MSEFLVFFLWYFIFFTEIPIFYGFNAPINVFPKREGGTLRIRPTKKSLPTGNLTEHFETWMGPEAPMD